MSCATTPRAGGAALGENVGLRLRTRPLPRSVAACAGNDKPKKDFRSWKLSQSEDMLSPEDIVRQVVRESGMRIAFTRESAADEEDESWEVRRRRRSQPPR